MKKQKILLLVTLSLILIFAALLVNAQKKLNPVPTPAPTTPHPGSQPADNPMVLLSKSQNYSASRVSSYQPQGGPRDNFWIPTTGEEVTLADIKGPGAVTHIWTTMRGPGRDLIIRAYWDGSEHPSVEAPIGDFFGVAMDVNANINSYPIQVSAEGRSRNCWWYMPFNRSARITATATKSEENSKLETVALYFYIDYQAYAEPIKDINYFHAYFQETDPPIRGKNITFLDLEGEGHFVGVVMGHRARYTGWFGEGDDIITVDGKVSFAGTGTEDYFCDAWGFRIFSDLYHGVPVLEGREIGSRLSAYRFHILDPIPFRKSFKFDIEHWPWLTPLPNTGRGYYSSVGFWYQKTIHKAWPRLDTLISQQPWDPDKGRWFIPHALEAENLGVLEYNSRLGRNARPTAEKVLPNLSGDYMLVFDSGGEGEFSLAVPAEQSGEYSVSIYYARSPEYGIVKLDINGDSAGDPVDTFLRTDDLTRPLWPPVKSIFPGKKLVKGLNTFKFSIKNKHPDSDGYKMGIDCIILEHKQ